MNSSSPSPKLRYATAADVPAILALLLTSFRQFPLFDFLYSPLRQDLDRAVDTLFFWRRRVALAISDPDSAVVVAEIEGDEVGLFRARDIADGDVLASRGMNGEGEMRGEGQVSTGDEERPWRMLEWLESRQREQQRHEESKELIGKRKGKTTVLVGFAIWRKKGSGPALELLFDDKPASPSQWTLRGGVQSL